MNALVQKSGQVAASADDVLRAHFTLSSLEGAIECINFDGAEGWTSPNPHPALSLMRWNTSDLERARRALDAVLEFFQARNQSLEWMTGPSCVQAGLEPLLVERGFSSNGLSVAAMSRPLDISIPELDEQAVLTKRESGPACEPLGAIMGRGFSVPDAVGDIFHKAYLTQTSLQSSEVYSARFSGSDEVVGVGYLSYLGQGENSLLRASSVIPDARGQGAYRALVLHRLKDAAKNNCKEVFVHAYSKASRECLTSLGFQTLGGLTLHSWAPPK